MAKKRPGVMLYFDWLPALQSLSCEEQGRLLMAVLTYGKTGQVPHFTDRLLSFAWDSMQPHIDADEQRYAEVVELRRQAVNRRWEKEASRKTEERQPRNNFVPVQQSSVRSDIDQRQRYSAAMDAYLDF